MSIFELTPREKLTKARIQLLRRYPFFGYLALSLKFVEWNVGTFAVDDYGNFYYNPAIVERTDVDQLMFIIAHEVMHLALQHNVRRGRRNKMLWNVACDLAINTLLAEQFESHMIPEGVLMPPREIRDEVWCKSAEEIYDKLPKLGGKLDVHIKRLIYRPKRIINTPGAVFIPKGEKKLEFDEIVVEDINLGEVAHIGKVNIKVDEVINPPPFQGDLKQQGQEKTKGQGEGEMGQQKIQKKGQMGEQGQGQQQGEGMGMEGVQVGHDVHLFGENGKEKDTEKIRREAKEWSKRLVEAWKYAKNKGRFPAYLRGFIEEALSERIDWKTVLWRFVQEVIPSDYNIVRPNKKYLSYGYHLPSVVKENLDVVVALDTSGSIGDDEYAEFLGEVLAIAKSYSNVRITAILNDATVHKVVEEEQDIQYLMSEIKKREGYGGTDFRPVFKWIEENRPYTKLLVFFTDLYGDFPSEKPPYTVLWIVSKEGANENESRWKMAEKIGVVIKMQ